MDLNEIQKENAVNAILRLRNKRIREEKQTEKKAKAPSYEGNVTDCYVSENRVRHAKRRGRK